MTSLLYSKYAKGYDAAIRDNIYNANFERPSLLSLLPDVAGKKVLDLGCGPGVYSGYLLNRGADVCAVDGSSEMVEIVKNKFGSKLKCYIQNFEQGLPDEDDACYDLVISPLTIHYINDLQRLFRDVRRVLKPCGHFVFSTHHPIIDFKDSPSGNYFKKELMVQEWDILGHPVEVEFHRRSLTDLFNSITAANMSVVELTEGKPTEHMKEIAPDMYRELSEKPFFMFIKCR